MGRGPISKRIAPFLTLLCSSVSLPGISTPFGVLSLSLRQVAHVLLTRPPLKYVIASYFIPPLDLHVLGTPPAFVLSQDQTLKLIYDSHK